MRCAAGLTCSGSSRRPGGDTVFRQLVLARIIEPTNKQDSLRVLGEVGVKAVSYPTVNRRLPVYAKLLLDQGLTFLFDLSPDRGESSEDDGSTFAGIREFRPSAWFFSFAEAEPRDRG